MRKSRFSEEQVAVLKESEAGVKSGNYAGGKGSRGRVFIANWRRRNRQLNTLIASRTGGGNPCFEGGGSKKVASPQMRREAVLM